MDEKKRTFLAVIMLINLTDERFSDNYSGKTNKISRRSRKSATEIRDF